jgi:hypothetical protein
MPGGAAEVSGVVELLTGDRLRAQAGAASSSTISAPDINKRIRSPLSPPSIVMHSIGDNQQVAQVYFRNDGELRIPLFRLTDIMLPV